MERNYVWMIPSPPFTGWVNKIASVFKAEG